MAATILLAMLGTTPSHAAMPCWMIASYVSAYGEAAAVQWAKANGYTLAQIDVVRRRCAAPPKTTDARSPKRS